MSIEEKGDENGPVIVWFRDDLRIADNPALFEACESGKQVLCIFVMPENADAYGSAQNWFLHHALSGLDRQLREMGARLDLFAGNEADIIRRLALDTGASAVHWNRRYTQNGRDTDAGLKQELNEHGTEARSFLGSLLHEPYRIRTQEDRPYRVYTPFWRRIAGGEPFRHPLPRPEQIKPAGKIPGTVTLADLDLLPRNPDWAARWEYIWTSTEAGAAERLSDFLEAKDGIDGYADGRDFPSKANVSRLSPHLRFGTISSYQIWHATRHAADSGIASPGDAEKFLMELAWREFSYHLLFHYPDIGWKNFNERFDGFPWKEEESPEFSAWCRGMTGYPLVDAGMRELWQTGYMHNRVRMVTASFLVKHLLIHWRLGERWFHDTLVDADPANNAASWQWVAGSGADAAPYFRIFNPVTQSRKFDPECKYIHRFVPELAGLPDKYIHAPWEASESVLKGAGITLGTTYPLPVVDHSIARKKALEAFESTKQQAP